MGYSDAMSSLLLNIHHNAARFMDTQNENSNRGGGHHHFDSGVHHLTPTKISTSHSSTNVGG